MGQVKDHTSVYLRDSGIAAEAKAEEAWGNCDDGTGVIQFRQ